MVIAELTRNAGGGSFGKVYKGQVPPSAGKIEWQANLVLTEWTKGLVNR